ncbi:MAG: hypothetical protein WC455_03545 [Dehalococcoidia bacterium]|jgi:hypothetical protein
MKTKVILFALLIALVVGLAVPAFVSQPADAWGRHSRTQSADTTTTSSTTPSATPTPTPTTTTTLGPMMIGVMMGSNSFPGIAMSIKLGGDGSLTLANIRGISLDGGFKLSLAYDVQPAPHGMGAITSGRLSSSGRLPLGSNITGQYFDLEVISPDLGGNYFLLFNEFGDATELWGGILIANLPGIATILPGALTAMGGPDISCLMPTIQKLIQLINPFMINHPIILCLPMSSMMKLMPLMGMSF